MTLAFSKQQLSAVWEGGLGMSTQGGGGSVGGTDDRQPLEAFLGQGGLLVPLLCCRRFLGRSSKCLQEAKA